MADEEHHGDYSELKDLQLSLRRGEEGSRRGFCLCLWIYLCNSARPPTAILRQMQSDIKDEVPFLVLNKESKMTLFPLMFLHKEAPSPGSSFSWTDIPCASANIECPLEKWVHVGCEVAANYVRLHIDGTVAEEKPLSLTSENDTDQDNSEGITLAGSDGGAGKLQGYTYGAQILTVSSSVKDHLAKSPPIQLALDGSCISDGIEEGGDGIWSIVGGKASCRRNFSLEVVLLDALGRHVHNEIEVFASLVYADNGIPVEKPNDDAEDPLLASCDGLEFPSTDRPVKLTHGRASFKLKISQLSSKCDNRLFCVRFHSSNSQKYPFLEAYSPPVRCISRNRYSRTYYGLGKKLSPITQLLDGSLSLGGNEGSPEIQDNYGDDQLKISNLSESKRSPPSKQLKVGYDKSLKKNDANGISQQRNYGCNSNALKENDDENAIRSLEPKFGNLGGIDNVPSDSESTDARNSGFKRTEVSRTSISDATIFKYCLEGTYERCMLLKEVITYASHHDMTDFAEQVSIYAGCSHHRYQILIARELINEADESWNLISRSNHRVLWRDAVPEIERKFMKISGSASRGLSGQDIEVLRRIAGCADDITQEIFDKIWYWLYPVAFTLSKEPLNVMWECMSPKWIEGLITKEEAESSLRGPSGLQKPGTFILRFPTSRSWPHPDAGSLVVTYVGLDGTLHNKLLSLDYREMNPRPIQDLLLEEPELTQLGRVTRQGT